jgi:hypothetical protein
MTVISYVCFLLSPPNVTMPSKILDLTVGNAGGGNERYCFWVQAFLEMASQGP